MSYRYCGLRPLYNTISAYGWRRGVVVSVVSRTNEVNPRLTRLVLGWVTVLGRVYTIPVYTRQLGQLSLASLYCS